MTKVITKRPTVAATKQHAAPKSPSKRQLQVLELALSQHPVVGKFFATASESEREALLKGVFKYGNNFKQMPESEYEAIYNSYLKDPIAFKQQLKISAASKKELEPLWKENKQKFSLGFEQFGINELFERSPTLRGRDFVGELIRLSRLTKDPRFSDAVKALSEHGIIDDKNNFKRWQPQRLTEVEAYKNSLMLGKIRDLVKKGKSIRRACVETAATLGQQAATFDAAIKQLELLYASDGKKGAA